MKLKAYVVFFIALTSLTNCFAKHSKVDPFVKKWAGKKSNECVSVVGDQLILYAHPSGTTIAVDALVSLTMGALATGCGLGFYFSSNRYSSDKVDKVFLGIGTALFGICSLACFVALIKDLTMRSNKNIEYIKLDDEGIHVWGELRAKWRNIESIFIQSTAFYQDGIKTGDIRTASFYGKYMKSLWDIQDNDMYLPVSFDDFVSISEYFLNKYNPKQVPATI